MRLHHSARPVLHRLLSQVLHQRPSAPHIQHLRPKAYRQDRLAHIVCVLQQQLIHILPRRIRRRALRNRLLAHTSADSRLPPLPGSSIPWQLGDQLRRRRRRLTQWHLDRLAPAPLHRSRILLPRPLVVLSVRARRHRNGDARLGSWLGSSAPSGVVLFGISPSIDSTSSQSPRGAARSAHPHPSSSAPPSGSGRRQSIINGRGRRL